MMTSLGSEIEKKLSSDSKKTGCHPEFISGSL